MKHLVFILAALALFVGVASAQVEFSPQGQPMYYTYTLTADNAYVISEVDTLPGTASLTSTQVGANLGGATMSTLLITVNDSAKIDVYVDWAYTGLTTFTNTLTDSLIHATTGAKTQEYILRIPGTDEYGGLGRHARVRLSFRSAGQGFTSPTYTAKVLYKP